LRRIKERRDTDYQPLSLALQIGVACSALSVQAEMLIFISSMAALKRKMGLPSLDDQDLELLFAEEEVEDEDVADYAAQLIDGLE
jgi:hypothetical protein